MRVMMLVKNSEIGGVASCVSSLAEGLKKYKGVESVICISPGESVDYMLKDNIVELIDFSKKSPKDIYNNYKRLIKIAKRYQIDIMHAHNRVPALMGGVIHNFHKEIPYIWSNHLVPIPHNFIHRKLTWYGAYAVAESLDGRDMLADDFGIPDDKIKIVNLGVDFSKFKQLNKQERKNLKTKYGIVDTEKVILLYGRLEPVKGHEFLIRALKPFRNLKFKVVFPGQNDLYKEHLLAIAKKAGLKNHILFPGFVNGSEWLSIADLMVLPSRKEGFGIVNVEAFAMGVPVIRTKTAGYRDMQNLCFGVEYGDVDGLKDLLCKFFDNDKSFGKMGQYSKENCERFSLKSYANQYYDIYMRALKR